MDDKLESLIISGNPAREELEETKLKLIAEFTELSCGGEIKAYMYVVKSYHAQRNVITGFQLSMQLILAGKFESAIGFLNKNGVQCSIPKSSEDIDSLVRTVEMKYKNKLAKFKEIIGQYKSLSSKKGEKPTRAYYNRLLVMLSTCEIIKIQLNPKKMTVAEFAEYLNVFNEYQNQLKIRKNGRHHR